ncbi:TRAP transporter substrate-binding protein [Clostridiales bacterium TF09-2AC]|nr:TRAP transporter substrate-binding protein [Clostridiales bacterium TF09-2AC]
MMKRIIAAGLIATMVMGLCACGGNKPAVEGTKDTAASAGQEAKGDSGSSVPDGADAEYTELAMRLGTSSAETTLTAKTFAEWGERIKEKSGGRIQLDIYCSSVLGNNTEMVQGAQMGTIDIACIQPGGIADMGAKKMNLLALPYLFENYEQYYNTLFGAIGEELLNDVTDNVNGLVGFGFLPDGGRCYFTKGKAIEKLEDIQGMKLRVQAYEIDTDTAAALGFSSTPTAFSELYSAMQTGVVDGAENPLSGIDGNALYEVSDYLTLDNHTYNVPVMIMSGKTWNGMNPATQQLLKDEWKATVEEFYKPQLFDYEESLKRKFKDAGVEVIELTDHDKWVEAVQPVWEKHGDGLKDLIQGVQEIK